MLNPGANSGARTAPPTMPAYFMLGLCLFVSRLTPVAPVQAQDAELSLPPETCEATSKELGVLILVNSACANKARRDAIRSTWAEDLSEVKGSRGGVNLKFVVGTSCGHLDEVGAGEE